MFIKGVRTSDRSKPPRAISSRVTLADLLLVRSYTKTPRTITNTNQIIPSPLRLPRVYIRATILTYLSNQLLTTYNDRYSINRFDDSYIVFR